MTSVWFLKDMKLNYKVFMHFWTPYNVSDYTCNHGSPRGNEMLCPYGAHWGMQPAGGAVFCSLSGSHGYMRNPRCSPSRDLHTASPRGHSGECNTHYVMPPFIPVHLVREPPHMRSKSFSGFTSLYFMKLIEIALKYNIGENIRLILDVQFLEDFFHNIVWRKCIQ